MPRMVTGLFEKRRDVDLVIEHLVQEFDIPRERILSRAIDASGAEAHSTQDSNLNALADLGLPDAATRDYAEAMRRGSILLSAWVEEVHLRHVWQAYREYGATSATTYEGSAGSGETSSARLPDQDTSPDR
jgi:hypothetical protein